MYVMYNVYGLSWLCNLYDGRYQCFDTSMATGQVVDLQWAVLGCRSLVLVNNQVLNKIKIAVRILSRKGRI